MRILKQIHLVLNIVLTCWAAYAASNLQTPNFFQINNEDLEKLLGQICNIIKSQQKSYFCKCVLILCEYPVTR